jgi:prepilin signal peptidase PulO-like enzyme (type II secretory pathway)
MNPTIIISLTVIVLLVMLLDSIMGIRINGEETVKDAFIGFVIGAVSFWYAKCPLPRAYRYITDKFI